MRARISAALAQRGCEHELDDSVPDDIVERLELEFGDGAFSLLDSDDIEKLIASGAVWIPSIARKTR